MLDFIVGMLLGALCVFILMLQLNDFDKIYSNERIEPSIKITIEGGKSDTLFIYKKNNKK
jgi:hypothetical protein